MKKTADTGLPSWVKARTNKRGEVLGYTGVIYTAAGLKRSPQWPIDVTRETVERWKRETQAAAKTGAALKQAATPVATGFLAIADSYLEDVQAMPQYAERCRHIRLWAALFGERAAVCACDDPQRCACDCVKSDEIRRQRDKWLTVGPKWVQVGGVKVQKPLPLSAQEVNLRLRALENLYSVKFRGKVNPVRDVNEAVDDRPSIARGQSFALAEEILAFMPDVTRPEKGGAVEAGSASRARFALMVYTGLEREQVARLDEALHVDWRGAAGPMFQIPKRRKGTHATRRPGAKAPAGRWIPMVPEAEPWFRVVFARALNRPFSKSSLRKSVRAAVAGANQERRRLKLPLHDTTLRVKDWTRHTFGTEMYRRTGDLKVVQELMGHSDIKQTEIYARAALNERVFAAVRGGVKTTIKRERTVAPRRRPTLQRTLQRPLSPLAVSGREHTPRANISKNLKKTGAPGQN